MKTWAKDAGDAIAHASTLRLVQGRTARDGRVEVRRSGAWGSVCGELWDLVDANVLCRLLGYNEALAYYQNITFKQSNNTLWLTDVQCVGNESSLFHCVNSGWGKRTCNEGLAAGATCSDRSWGISLAIPQYVSSTLDSLTIKCSIPDVTDITYTIQIWSNTTDKWYDTKCRRRSNVVGSCVVKVPKAIITLTGLSPGHIYYLRLVSPYLVYSQVSESMATKELGDPSVPRFVSSSDRSITLVWKPTPSEFTNYSVEAKCCGETTWKAVECVEKLTDTGCTVSNNTATVIALKKDQDYRFRVLALYKSWKSTPSASSEAMRIKSNDDPYRIWIGSMKQECVASKIGDKITLFCHASVDEPTNYKWTKGQSILNSSGDGVLNVTVSSLADFGIYTCQVTTSDDVKQYNITICQIRVLKEAATKDTKNGTVIAIITTCFICFGIFIIVLILLKMAQIYRRRKKQLKETNREEMAMLNYRQKSVRNNNEADELDFNS